MSQSQIMSGKSVNRVQAKCWDRRECCVNTRVFNALKPLMLTCFVTGLLFRVDLAGTESETIAHLVTATVSLSWCV